MDETVKRPVTLACLVLGALWTASVPAQTLPDPTRPPAAVLTPAPAGTPIVPAGPQLQSILISTRADGRRIAVIDGQTVREGEKFKGAVLVKMTQTAVVLGYGSERHVLKLFPAANPNAARAATR